MLAYPELYHWDLRRTFGRNMPRLRQEPLGERISTTILQMAANGGSKALSRDVRQIGGPGGGLIERTARRKLVRTAQTLGDGRARAGDAIAAPACSPVLAGRADPGTDPGRGLAVGRAVRDSVAARRGHPAQPPGRRSRRPGRCRSSGWSSSSACRASSRCASQGRAWPIAGAALQGVFRNPLVDSQIIGVSSGAAFGGAWPSCCSTARRSRWPRRSPPGSRPSSSSTYSRITRQTPILLLVLAGVVTSAFFSALISLIKFVADPDNKLPAIVYWLMGSFAGASWRDRRHPGRPDRARGGPDPRPAVSHQRPLARRRGRAGAGRPGRAHAAG